ncbi:MAG: AAA family ATPase [Ignavibacteriaceae bacterium]|nr:MAG: AAA family ATPase [Ignavibacteriaceae bacterium]MBV6443761.1 hypothetical protein [Ignavibacteriaceae bacterium]WKZ71571.1 MAG: AAA family ATPase [Ignavibacteriaceae bacterium]
MKLTIKNLGKISESSFELNDLTVLVGDNNSGKTYITYTTYGVIKYLSHYLKFGNLKKIVDELKVKGQVKLEHFDLKNLMDKSTVRIPPNNIKKLFRNIFNDKESIFENATFELEYLFPETLKDSRFEFRLGKNTTLEGEIKNNILNLTLTLTSKVDLENTTLTFLLSDLLKSIFIPQILPNPFIVTAERLGISLFYKELDERRNFMIEGLQKLQHNEDDLHPLDLITGMSAYYATPIRDHIAFTRNIDNFQKNRTKIDLTKTFEILKQILGAEFKKETKKDIRFYTKKKKINKFDIPLYLASSSARCLVDIYFFLRCIAKPGDLLIVDEPESHLTLRNQRFMAKLFASLVNSGIKVFITTHSDFLVKELNNLIMLNNEFEGKENFLKEFKNIYDKNDFLSPNKISIYQAKNGKLEKMEVTEKGVAVPYFDEEINSIFEASSELDFLLS